MDLVMGDGVIFDYGLLLLVMWVSMVVLGLFVFIEVGGCMLVDGGLVSNLFVQFVCDMGVDIIIVVNIGLDLQWLEDFVLLVVVMQQMIIIFVGQNVWV